ncbi:MAG TPA: hypothetical protein VK665_05070 [Candidatus Elarobacter sp.]|nr:hypothetical protein [Candidatus Elarobacter sp.]
MPHRRLDEMEQRERRGQRDGEADRERQARIRPAEEAVLGVQDEPVDHVEREADLAEPHAPRMRSEPRDRSALEREHADQQRPERHQCGRVAQRFRQKRQQSDRGDHRGDGEDLERRRGDAR